MAITALGDIAFIDVEASALINGYPISVGWFSLGSNGLADGTGWSALIRPDPNWLAVGNWDANAQHIHGITLERLIAEGLPAAEVAARLNADLGARAAVLSDQPGHDKAWLSELHLAAGVPTTYALRAMETVEELVPDLTLPLDWQMLRNVVAQRFGLTRHRALDDAKVLAGLVWLVSREELY